MPGFLDGLKEELEGEFGKRLEEATAATEDLREEVEKLRRTDEALLKEIKGLRRDLNTRDE